jgi:hypothetical protein
MTKEELDNWLLEHENMVSWFIDDDNEIVIKHDALETKIKLSAIGIEKATPQVLVEQLTKGTNVDHITRVTGYFGKTSGFNKGKIGELKDRYKATV